MRKPVPPREVAFIDVDGLNIDVEIATRPIARCSMDQCGGHCCRLGAIVSPEEVRTIDALLIRILPLLRPHARRGIRRLGWRFMQDVHEPYADPSKRYKATRVIDGTCVFRMARAEGGCALHALALQDGVRIPDYKPRECVLFPVNDSVDGIVHMHTWKGYPCTEVQITHKPAYQTLQTELTILLGITGYQKLTDGIAALEATDVRLKPIPFSDPEPRPRGRPPKRQPHCHPAAAASKHRQTVPSCTPGIQPDTESDPLFGQPPLKPPNKVV